MGDVTHWQHNNNEDNIKDTHAFCSLPSGSNDWKTLRACSDGDSGPTRDISYRERRNRKVGRNKKESTKKEKIEHSERLCVTIRRDLSKK